MWKFLGKFRGGLDRTKNSLWGKRVAVAYALGTWTLLGVVFVKWKLNHFEQPSLTEPKPEMSQEDMKKLMKEKTKAQQKRSEEISLYVAENVYTPLDFMA